MLLVQDARLLLLDEPVAGMSQAEREETGQLLQRIGAQRTVVVVEHDMEFLRSFASSVTVLHQGSVLSEGTVAQVQADPKVVEVYLGRGAGARGRREASMLELTGVHVGYGRTSVVHGVDVEVADGGVTAIMGHNGAGKTTLLRAAVGLLPVAQRDGDADGEDVIEAAAAPAGAPRARLRAAGPAVVRAADRAGEPAARRRRCRVAPGRRGWTTRSTCSRRCASCSAAAPGCCPAASASSSPSPGRC